jgi:hypothetical protein
VNAQTESDRKRAELLDQIAVNERVLASAEEVYKALQARRNQLRAELAALDQQQIAA